MNTSAPFNSGLHKNPYSVDNLIKNHIKIDRVFFFKTFFPLFIVLSFALFPFRFPDYILTAPNIPSFLDLPVLAAKSYRLVHSTPFLSP